MQFDLRISHSIFESNSVLVPHVMLLGLRHVLLFQRDLEHVCINIERSILALFFDFKA